MATIPVRPQQQPFGLALVARFNELAAAGGEVAFLQWSPLGGFVRVSPSPVGRPIGERVTEAAVLLEVARMSADDAGDAVVLEVTHDIPGLAEAARRVLRSGQTESHGAPGGGTLYLSCRPVAPPAGPGPALLLRLAQEHLCVDRLDMRGSDRLDFVEVSRGGIEAALRAAFLAGAAGRTD